VYLYVAPSTHVFVLLGTCHDREMRVPFLSRPSLMPCFSSLLLFVSLLMSALLVLCFSAPNARVRIPPLFVLSSSLLPARFSFSLFVLCSHPQHYVRLWSLLLRIPLWGCRHHKGCFFCHTAR